MDQDTSMRRLVPATTAFIVIDVQERLARVMPEADFAQLLRGVRILLEAARLLHAPVLVTEQYPKGLGPTVPELGALLQAVEAERFEKTAFSACGAAGFMENLRARSVEAAVVAGMETHVCVFQTVRDLLAAKLPTYVPIDAVVSRRADHRQAGLGLCERAGGIQTTSETVVFDWLAESGTEEFRALSKLIR